MLCIEQNDEWLVGRGYLSAESISLVLAGPDDHTDKEIKEEAPGSKRPEPPTPSPTAWALALLHHVPGFDCSGAVLSGSTPGDTPGDTIVSEGCMTPRSAAEIPEAGAGHAERFRVSLRSRNAPLCRHFSCRRRDSNPRHADYDSAALWLYRAKNAGWGTQKGTQMRGVVVATGIVTRAASRRSALHARRCRVWSRRSRVRIPSLTPDQQRSTGSCSPGSRGCAEEPAMWAPARHTPAALATAGGQSLPGSSQRPRYASTNEPGR